MLANAACRRPAHHAAAGGNARDLAREKGLKKQAEKEKGRKEDGLTLQQRQARSHCAIGAAVTTRGRDAAALQAKTARKQEEAPKS